MFSMEVDPLTASKLPSAVFFTFFNTYGTLNCCATTENLATVACGYSDSVVRVHKADGSSFQLKKWTKFAKKRGGQSSEEDGASAGGGGNGNGGDGDGGNDAAGERLNEDSGADLGELYRLDFVGHQGPVYGVDFCTQDHKYLASASADRSVRLWRLTDGAFVRKCVWHPALQSAARNFINHFPCFARKSAFNAVLANFAGIALTLVRCGTFSLLSSSHHSSLPRMIAQLAFGMPAVHNQFRSVTCSRNMLRYFLDNAHIT